MTDASGQPLYEIVGPCCTWKLVCCCRYDREFDVLDLVSKEEVTKIRVPFSTVCLCFCCQHLQFVYRTNPHRLALFSVKARFLACLLDILNAMFCSYLVIEISILVSFL